MNSRTVISCLQQSTKSIRNARLMLNKRLHERSLSLCVPNTKATVIINNSKNTELIKSQRSLIHLSAIKFNDVITIESPQFAESIKEGDIRFEKKVGDFVKQDELIAKIETDKTAMEIFAPKSGIVEALLVEEGSAVTANLPIIKLKLAAAGSSAPVPATASATPPPPSPPTPTPTPAAQPAVASSKSTAPPPLPKSPASSTPVSKVPITPYTPPGSGAPVDINKIGGSRAETRVKMSKMRQTVANRLKQAQNTCAMLTTFNEINMANLVDLRKTYGDQFQKKHQLKLGFMSAFVKASAAALQDQPIVNAVIENNEIVYRDYVDISVAVATPKGLVVPVVRNVERMNYADIEKEIASLGERARLNKLAIEDMQGGTFTISNGGVFGSLFGTPIINLPQSSILGMHGIFDRPVAVNGQVVIRPMMFVALTYDHRLIDGREAVLFLRKIKAAVEDPRSLLLD